MTAQEKRRLDDLERRVRELEARPVYPVIIVQPYVPPPQPFYTWPPGYPIGPFYVYDPVPTVVTGNVC